MISLPPRLFCKEDDVFYRDDDGNEYPIPEAACCMPILYGVPGTKKVIIDFRYEIDCDKRSEPFGAGDGIPQVPPKPAITDEPGDPF